MKALMIKEPYASMIWNGKKTIETRTWPTSHRGKLLLCASKRPESALSGKAFAVADLVDCKRMTESDKILACCDLYNAYSWILKGIKRIEPFKVRGQLGLFEVNLK